MNNFKITSLHKILVSVILSVLVFGTSFYSLFLQEINYKISNSDKAIALVQDNNKNTNQVAQSEVNTPKIATLSEDFYILLLGVDASDNRRTGDEAHLYNDIFRSDSILVAHVDTNTNHISLCSLNRDIPTLIDGYEDDGIYKLNAAYALGGEPLIETEVEQLMNIDISYYAIVDMEGLQSIIDSVGGIDGDVERAFYDDVLFAGIDSGGWQHLNGEQALLYSRSRYAWVDDDYARMRHQKEVLKSLALKVMNGNILDKYSFVQEVSNHISTNMDIQQMNELADKLDGMDVENNLHSLATPTEGIEYEGVWWEILKQEAWNDLLNIFYNNIGEEFNQYNYDITDDDMQILKTNGENYKTNSLAYDDLSTN